ncbi:MAG: DUF3568 family protein [Opitutaceae bacterium]
MKHRLPFLLLLAAVFALGGCAHVREATNDAVAWVRDALQTTVDAPLDRTVQATTRALKNLQFAAVATRSDALSGVVTAQTARDEKIEITITSVTPVQTRLDIRVGTFGDRPVSQRILSEIQKELRE